MRLVILLFVLFYAAVAHSQESRDTSYVGVFLKSLYDFSPAEYSFGADFYLWSNCTSSLPLFDQLEITNAKKIEEYSSFRDEDRKAFVSYKNCKVQLTHDWELSNYPFDKQRLRINIEGQSSIEFIYLLKDKAGFEIADDLRIPGWEVEKFQVEESFKFYRTDFGYRNTKFQERRFNHISFVVTIDRDSWDLYFKLFSGLYIAFFVSFLSFFIRPDFVDPRFGLSVGGLFASVANKYVVDANIPASISFSFVDKVHFLTFFYILGTLVLSSISLRLHTIGEVQKRKKIDRRAALIMLITYILLNILLVLFVL